MAFLNPSFSFWMPFKAASDVGVPVVGVGLLVALGRHEE